MTDAETYKKQMAALADLYVHFKVMSQKLDVSGQFLAADQFKDKPFPDSLRETFATLFQQHIQTVCSLGEQMHVFTAVAVLDGEAAKAAYLHAASAAGNAPSTDTPQ